MAEKADDVTDEATSMETASVRRARGQLIQDVKIDPDALAQAMKRVRDDETKVRDEVVPEIVRASVRAGNETTRRVLGDGSAQLVTSPKKITFSAEETADGREWTVESGRPVHLKRAAFLHYRAQGLVEMAC